MELTQPLRDRMWAFAGRVAPIYALLQWEWVKDSDYRYVPNQAQIYSTLKELAVLTPDVKDTKSSTGGIEVCIEDGDIGFAFVLNDDISFE